MDESGSLFAKVIAAYAAEGFPHDVIGQWTLPENDVTDLIELVRHYQPKRILEVGTFVGLSTVLIALVAGKDAHITSIDPGFPLGVEMGSMGSVFGKVNAAARTHDIARAVARRLGVLDQIDFVAGGFSSGATFASRRANTEKLVPIVGPGVCGERGPFDFVFIDGLHYADVVQSDLELAALNTLSNGVVLVHDCVGMWGSNVRCGVLRFLSTQPDWQLLHAPFRQLYHSIGVVFRSASCTDLATQLLDSPSITPYLNGLFQPLAISLANRLSPHGLVEIAVREAVLVPHFKNVGISQIILVDSNWTQSLEACVVGLQARGIDSSNILIVAAGALDVVEDDAFARVLSLIGERGVMGAFMRTPPGERSAACRFSRPLRRWVSMAETNGAHVRGADPFDLAPSRFLFCKGADRKPSSSSLCNTVVISPKRAEALDSLQAFPILSEIQADAIEQAELLQMHYSAGFQRMFDDFEVINEQRNNELNELNQLRTMTIQRAFIGFVHRHFAIWRKRLASLVRPISATDAAHHLIEGALAHAMRHGRGRPIVMLNFALANETAEALSVDSRLAGFGVKVARDELAAALHSVNLRIGFYNQQDQEWRLPQGSNTVYFSGPARSLSRSMLEAAWRAGVTHLYARAGACWVRIPLRQLQRLAMLARDITKPLMIRQGAMVSRLANSRWRAYLPSSLGLLTYDEGFSAALKDAALRSDFVRGRVVVVCGNLAPGGAERQVTNTLMGLNRSGLTDVSFLAHHLQDGPGRLNFHLPRVRAAGIPAREIKRLIKSINDAEMPKSLRDSAQALPTNLVLDIANLVQEFVHLRPQVVHAWLDWDNIRAGIAAGIAGVPRIVVSGRNLAPYNFNLYHPYMDAAYRALARLPQIHFVNNSQAGADNYADWIGIPRERIQVIYNGLDSGGRRRLSEAERAEARAKLGLAPKCFVIGGMFRFDEEKRPLLWLEVASRVAAMSSRVHFILHGQGPLRKAMEARIEALGLSKLVTMAGVTDDSFNAMSVMDVLLLTSRGEGLPNVVIEAQCVGTAVVCTNAGGAREAIDPGKTGWVVDSDDPADLAKAVVDLIFNPKTLLMAFEEGPAFVQCKFGMERMVAETVEAYGLETAQITKRRLVSA
jgi:glycosyltransferase involved in cell wall biosynthesis/predicted O-methyltransferase YrrM